MIRINSSFAVFVVKKLDTAKAFYSTNFGFSVVFENEWYIHLISESGVQPGFTDPHGNELAGWSDHSVESAINAKNINNLRN